VIFWCVCVVGDEGDGTRRSRKGLGLWREEACEGIGSFGVCVWWGRKGGRLGVS